MGMRVGVRLSVMMVFLCVFCVMVVLVFVGAGVGMPVRMGLILFRTAHGDFHMRAGNAAAVGRQRRDLHAGQTQGAHACQKLLLLAVGAKLIQGSHQHVAGHAHGTFQIQRFHASPSI